MLAVKDNREYTITEADKSSFINEGYDIYDDNGGFIAYGAGKKIPYDKYMKLLNQFEAVNNDNIALREKVGALQAEIIELRDELSAKRSKKGKE